MLDVKTFTGTLAMKAQGGYGGTTDYSKVGPGGGGGGGIVWFNKAFPKSGTFSLAGGKSGLVSNASTSTNWGALDGKAGDTLRGFSITYDTSKAVVKDMADLFVTNDTTICYGA